MAQEWSLVSEAHSANLSAILPHFQYHLDQVVDVALRIDAARNGKADKIHLRGIGKHQGADFDRTDAPFQIEFRCEGNSRKLFGRNLRNERRAVVSYGRNILCAVIRRDGRRA